MTGTLVGLAPLCWAQAYLSEGILTAVPPVDLPAGDPVRNRGRRGRVGGR